ncbi:MAG: ribosome recycling factor [Clostridiales bacterium]|jgi:ribosome recycling factor|nr:ribosome recycling factor [Clostridiales bacterium]MBF0926828.1 ribosome recycling factor [Clostridiales bacterium]
MSLENIDEKMDKVIERLEVNFSEIRAGRANPAILNKVQVEYYGAMSPLSQIASISVPEARLIVIQPWDKSLLSQIVRAIEMSDIGINPMNDGQVIRLSFPELTEERRKDLVKDVRKLSEESKVAIRNIRRDEMDLVKTQLKNSEISEDEAKADENKIQKKTDDYVAKIEEITTKKEKEIMTV